jgi:uncharacterized protein
MELAAARSATARRDLVCAAAGLVVAIVATSALSALRLQGPWALPLAYLAAWVPMVGAVVVACVPPGPQIRAAWRLASARLGLRFGLFDVFWGIAAGCLARAFDASVNLLLHGSTGLAPQPTLGGPPDLGVLILAFLAPVLLAPVIEEVFFRGLLQRALVSALGERMPRLGAAVLGVIVASAVFELMHVVGSGSAALIGTFVFGLIAGTLTAATGRIGGAVVAHVVFNGIAVLLMWPY